jgi:hypothetical protein
MRRTASISPGPDSLGGAELTRPVADQFYGDRTGGLTDPFGHIWYVMTHVEDLSIEETRRRARREIDLTRAPVSLSVHQEVRVDV